MITPGQHFYWQAGFSTDLSVIRPQQKINAVGYCIGRTLLSIAAAAMARDGDDRCNSISSLAAQTDFSEAGEITRFISYSQLSILEKLMRKRGYLGSEKTFLLTSGGHNAGIVSGPEHPRRRYRVHTRKNGDKFIAPEGLSIMLWRLTN